MIVPLPGSARPMASVRQFMELAVNIPEQDPQVGQALRSYCSASASVTLGSAALIIASMRSILATTLPLPGALILPASIGPPETNTVGMFSRMAAMSIPGVILSQLEMHTMASAQCALTMYSTESAISSREGSEYSMPLWP